MQQLPFLRLQEAITHADIHTLINLLHQTNMLLLTPPPLSLWSFGLGDWHCTADRLWILYWLCMVIKGSLDIMWLSTLHHLWHLQSTGEKPLQLEPVWYISVVTIFQSWLLFCIPGSSSSSADLTIHWITLFFSFNFNPLLMCSSAEER